MHADAHIFGAPRATPGSVTRVCFRTYVRSRDAPDDPFRSGPRAFTIIHVNCPQHARSCPKSHAPWLHFAAGQTFRTVSESVLRRTSARGPDGALSSPHGNANPLYVRGDTFFSATARFSFGLRESNGGRMRGARRYYGPASVECSAINKSIRDGEGEKNSSTNSFPRRLDKVPL